jgi:linoleoyl-CoA desaturase
MCYCDKFISRPVSGTVQLITHFKGQANLACILHPLWSLRMDFAPVNWFNTFVMITEKSTAVRFAPRGENGFYETVTGRVKNYFIASGVSPYANAQMWIKTIFMLLLYFVPYGIMVSGAGSASAWWFLGCWFLMGWGMSGIGTAVMHDANHGTYSPNKKINNFISQIIGVIGGYAATWRIQHNTLHHTYTNIAGMDEDIEAMQLIRLSPRQPWRPLYRYQHLYAWFFYMIMTLYWMTAKDYVQAVRYKKHDLLIRQKVSLEQALVRITLYKIFYYSYIMVLPLIFSGMPWWLVIVGFLLMHFTAGLFLSCVFQPAHVMEESAYAAPVISGGQKRMEDSWAIHEVVNTTNFAPRSHVFSWFVGGLNYQIEHHLFTGICHVHYKKIVPVVQSAIKEFNLPYHVQPTFLKALLEHARMLKKLGRR